MRRYSPSWISTILSRLRRDTRGVTAVLVGLLMVPLCLMLGGAVDLGVAYYLKNRLGYAVDSAALAVGSTVQHEVDIEQRARDFVAANYPSDAIGTVHDVTVTDVNNVITVSAKATFQTFFMGIFSLDEITVAAEAEVIRAIRGLEVALVLDNTGSMRSSNNIGALRDASRDFVNILFGDEVTNPNLFISIVPYAASVNPGPEALGGDTTPPPPAWWPESTDPGYIEFRHNPDDGGPFADGQGWKGCVLERTGTDLLDDTPGGWEAWAWPPEPDHEDLWDDWPDVPPGPDQTEIVDYLSDHKAGSRYYTNDSNNYDLYNMAGSVTEGGVRYDPGTFQNNGAGPNLGCPGPILPLNNVKSIVLDTVDSLDAWHRGGTMADLGLAWGRRVLSPEPPFTEGEPWGKELWEKAIVMMTDGNNEYFKLTSNATNGNSTNNWYNRDNDRVRSDYSGIGWLSSDNPRIGTNNRGTANDIVDARMAVMCADLKAQGIIVYTVTFGNTNSTTEELYRNCATDPSKWFDSPSQADLRESFKAIAVELSNLRVSR
ncbi:TadE/TadG family type IV pilus assembly protein [Rhodospira trueperi]|uniref:Flp pilus assembly protein TadG n=1 Tax=Rhodospira trueperi TaxID=69960 RepID=A0A1G7E5Y7_9PROT|nr:TadE/TadG family type IV pilus assembly protein [Rhodospira trueperi]SDE59154.1 Flp pilus assembly protein TadG [Rhodospira trueperi]